jgi:polyhydroxyalkanoate synthesis regulator phasin
MQMSANKKIAAVVLTTVALSVGTVGVASASPSKSNGKSVSVRQTTTRATVSTIANPMAGGVMSKKGDQGAGLATVLSTLVKAGTITQAQADAITAAATAARSAHEANKGANRAAHQTLIATTIGKSTAEIQAGLAAGKSLGVIAGDKRAALITALVADHRKKIDAAVTAGKMTAAQATTMKADLTAHVTAKVDAVRPAMGPGMGKGGQKGGHGPNH